ncbi:DMT family transporter [Acetobacter sp. TBRC 12305]|uniref:DMT family transporter n=1 Tax=Acetobacter garciniae TaxID=2817435 RepID=A0A939KRQ2_9PROT|nr:DMT family transporter [Acetobacter garciniae]MBO1325811.1 DMT family transporter [Acetobacter garciniae]MBX0345711.1 DMT family transporter [Acetobacter garciniae]
MKSMRYVIMSFECALFWATTGIFIRGIHGIAGIDIVWLRFFLCSVFSVFYLKKFLASVRRDIVIFPSLLMSGYYICATVSFMYIPIAIATLLVSLSPAVPILFNVCKYKTIHLNEIASFCLIGIGITLFLWRGDAHHAGMGMPFLIGLVLALSAACVRGVFSILIWEKGVKGHAIEGTLINTATFVYGFILTTPHMVFAYHASMLTYQNMIAAVLLAFVSTYLPTSLNTRASVKVSPFVHQAVGMVTPVLAGIMAWLALGEKMSGREMIGCCVVLAGLALVLRARPLPKSA